MFMNRKRFGFYSLIAITMIFFYAGCATPPVTNNMTVMELFAYGKKLLDKEDYKNAVEVYKKVKFNFPDSKRVATARLKAADTYYRDEKYEESAAEYKEFTKYHSANAQVPFAYYRAGMCNFNQILSADLDQTATEEAIKNFSVVIDEYQHSPYADIAKDRKYFCERRIADHEYFIGRFYYITQQYRPTIKRLTSFIDTFGDSRMKMRAMGLLAEALWKDEENEKALKTYKEIAILYPNTAYSKRARQMLRLYGREYEVELP